MHAGAVAANELGGQVSGIDAGLQAVELGQAVAANEVARHAAEIRKLLPTTVDVVAARHDAPMEDGDGAVRARVLGVAAKLVNDREDAIVLDGGDGTLGAFGEDLSESDFGSFDGEVIDHGDHRSSRDQDHAAKALSLEAQERSTSPQPPPQQQLVPTELLTKLIEAAAAGARLLDALAQGQVASNLLQVIAEARLHIPVTDEPAPGSSRGAPVSGSAAGVKRKFNNNDCSSDDEKAAIYTKLVGTVEVRCNTCKKVFANRWAGARHHQEKHLRLFDLDEPYLCPYKEMLVVNGSRDSWQETDKDCGSKTRTINSKEQHLRTYHNMWECREDGCFEVMRWEVVNAHLHDVHDRKDKIKRKRKL